MGSLHFLTTIEIWQLLLLITGILLVVFEMFFPGFGAPGITGVLLMLAGIILVSRNFVQAIILIIIILIILGVTLYFVLKSAKSGKLSKTLILNESLNKDSGFSGTEDLMGYLGKEGFAVTVLRPAGTAEFDGVKLDVVSESEFINMDAKVKITKVEGRRIVVKEI